MLVILKFGGDSLLPFQYMGSPLCACGVKNKHALSRGGG